MMYRSTQKMLVVQKKRAKQLTPRLLIKVTFQESIVSIRDELEWSDFDRNQLIASQFTVMNTKNLFWRGGRFTVLTTPLPFFRYIFSFDEHV